MSHEATASDTASSSHEASLGELVSQLSQQTSRLVSDELQLAKTELAESGKRYGIGAGLFGAAGVLGLYALGVLVATAILALALVLDAWLAALIVGVVLLAAAGVMALLGKGQIAKASPTPQQTISNVKLDVEAVKERGQS